MNKNYKISKTIGPNTFELFFVISYKDRPIIKIPITRINDEMSKEESEHYPFSNLENFENDWDELTEFVKDFAKNQIKNSQ